MRSPAAKDDICSKEYRMINESSKKPHFSPPNAMPDGVPSGEKWFLPLWIIASIVLACVVILALILSVPKAAGIQPYVVLSGSMEPAIRTGGIVFTDTNKADPEPDDIITFEVNDGSLVTHRVVRVDDESIVTKGDANETEDSAIHKDQVIGTVIFSIPFIGYAVSILTSRGSIMILLALVIFVFAFAPSPKKR